MELFDGKCPCGHDIDADDPDTCLIPDSDGVVHRVPGHLGYCTCHSIPIAQIEARR